MSKFVILVSCLAGLAWCAPTERPISNQPDDEYDLVFISADNSVVAERGHLVSNYQGDVVLDIEGRYRFVGNDGKVHVTKYHGGPEGFHVDDDGSDVNDEDFPLPVTPL